MFGRRKRQDELVIDAIREQLNTAAAHNRTVLTDAIERIDLRLSRDLEQRERLQASTEAAFEALRYSVTSSATDVARSLGQVANMCAMIAEQIEAERLERRSLTEAIALLARPPAPALEEPSRVIGGTVFASPELSHDEISIIEDDDDLGDDDNVEDEQHDEAGEVGGDPGGTELELEPAVDMWCRHDDGWVGGVEIADVRSDNDTTQYWLRRRSDGYIFPRAFDENDLRFVPDEPTPANADAPPG